MPTTFDGRELRLGLRVYIVRHGGDGSVRVHYHVGGPYLVRQMGPHWAVLDGLGGEFGPGCLHAAKRSAQRLARLRTTEQAVYLRRTQAFEQIVYRVTGKLSFDDERCINYGY
jgi:hypothetical protein